MCDSGASLSPTENPRRRPPELGAPPGAHMRLPDVPPSTVYALPVM